MSTIGFICLENLKFNFCVFDSASVGPVSKPRTMTLHEKKQFDQLKSLAKYQKIGTGPEALLFKKMLERRKAVSIELIFFLTTILYICDE